MLLKSQASPAFVPTFKPALILATMLALGGQSAQASPQLMTEVDARAAEQVQYASFNQWLSDFRRYAANQGISEATLAKALDGVRYRERVIELDRREPPGSARAVISPSRHRSTAWISASVGL